MGPTRGARGAGAAPSRHDSRRAHARCGLASGDPRGGGRSKRPPAPGMEPHALAGPGRVSPGTAPQSSAGREREGPAAAPSPARDGRPGFLPGSASRLQRVGTPPATPRPARLLTRTPPLTSLLVPGTRPAPAPDAVLRSRRLLPPHKLSRDYSTHYAKYPAKLRKCQMALPVQVTRKPVAPLSGDKGHLYHLWFLSGNTQ